MPKYTVKSPLHHDGKEYAIGATVEMDERAAASLAGVVEPEAEKSPPAGPTDPAERLAASKTEIGALDPNVKGLWTKDGRPNLDALEGRLGWRPTAPERDQAWEELKPKAAE